MSDKAHVGIIKMNAGWITCSCFSLLGHLNRTEPSLMLSVTPVRLSAVKKTCLTVFFLKSPSSGLRCGHEWVFECAVYGWNLFSCATLVTPVSWNSLIQRDTWADSTVLWDWESMKACRVVFQLPSAPVGRYYWFAPPYYSSAILRDAFLWVGPLGRSCSPGCYNESVCRLVN